MTSPSASSRPPSSTLRRRRSRSACARSRSGPCSPAGRSRSAGSSSTGGWLAARRGSAPPSARSSRRASYERLAVEDGGADVFVPPGTELDRPRPSVAILLSPFENLLWDRPFARRILEFDHLIEVYKPAPQRRYGYYVLPFLWRDRIAGRADLKSERTTGELVVRAFHREDGIRPSGALDDALDRALDRLRRLIGLERVRR